MKHAFTVGLLLTSIPAGATAPGGALTEQLSDCAAVAEDAARLSCYDRLAAQPKSPAVETEGSLPKEGSLDAEALPPGHEIAEQRPVPDAIQKTKKDKRWLGIRPYKSNYILPVTYNDRVNPEPLDDVDTGFRPEEVEVKFQLSAQLALWENILEQNIDLYFAYTQLSFFQAYNTEYSAPFRDTSYEPELGLNWRPDLNLMGWQLDSARVALNHQSNGQSEPLSRSWNRLLGQVRLTRENLALGLRVWKRLPEQADEDDNPDITDYLGHGEVFANYDLGRQRIGLMLRNPLKHAAVQLDWSYQLSDSVSLYMQYFNGYGESLIDYDYSVNRIGVGFSLNQ